MENENEFLNWDSPFMAEESSFTLLPAGEYPFTVVGFERKIYDGKSDKIANGTPFAEIEMEFVAPEGTTRVTDRLYLMKKWQWKLTQFFTGIGQGPKVGQMFSPNWSVVVGSQGKAKLKQNKYTSMKSGQEVVNNQVDEYLEPAANGAVFQQPPYQSPQQASFQQPQQTPYQPPQANYQAPQQSQPQQGGYTPGAF